MFGPRSRCFGTGSVWSSGGEFLEVVDAYWRKDFLVGTIA